jgi:hypothetical protein
VPGKVIEFFKLLCGALRRVLSDAELRGRAFEQNVRRIALEANMRFKMERLAAMLETVIVETRP